MDGKRSNYYKEESKNVLDDTFLNSGLRIPEIPKSIVFKNNCFSPSKSSSSTQTTHFSTQNQTSLTPNYQTQLLSEIVEDGEDDGPNFGIQMNLQSTILNNNFLNKSIMEFNKSKGQVKPQIHTEPAFHSTPDVLSNFRSNSENFYNIEEKFPLYESAHKIPNRKVHLFDKPNSKMGPAKNFHPTFKLDFNVKQQIPPTDDNAGLSSRMMFNLEEDLKFLKKMKAENHIKKKTEEKKKLKSNIYQLNQDLEIFNMHENFEKNLELFKKEEEEFLRKIKKINLLEEDSSNERQTYEKSKMEQEFEASLFHMVLEERNLSKDEKEFDTKKSYKEPRIESKISLESKTLSGNIYLIITQYIVD